MVIGALSAAVKLSTDLSSPAGASEHGNVEAASGAAPHGGFESRGEAKPEKGSGGRADKQGSPSIISYPIIS